MFETHFGVYEYSRGCSRLKAPKQLDLETEKGTFSWQAICSMLEIEPSHRPSAHSLHHDFRIQLNNITNAVLVQLEVKNAVTNHPFSGYSETLSDFLMSHCKDLISEIGKDNDWVTAREAQLVTGSNEIISCLSRIARGGSGFVYKVTSGLL